MRLGLYGAADEVAAASWASVVASLGAVAVAVSIRTGGAAARPFPWDALLVSSAVGAGDGDDARPLREAVEGFARAGGPVLGIGGGFQALCALGLLPGRVVDGAGAPGAESGHLRVEGRPTPFTAAIPAGRILRSGPAPARLEYQIAEPQALHARGQVIFRYCDAAGGTVRRQGVSDPVRGPDLTIAGVCGESGNVVGLLADPQIVGGDGAQLLGSLRLQLGRAR
jgi:phosphoribosylformylglycinamidine (FGAM) synthase-like amidotransferase family enzyme